MGQVRRYVVLDTEWVSERAASVGEWRGEQLCACHRLDNATALALHVAAYGNDGVIVVDQKTGEKVFPTPDAETNHEAVPPPRRKLSQTVLRSTRASRVKKAG